MFLSYEIVLSQNNNLPFVSLPFGQNIGVYSSKIQLFSGAFVYRNGPEWTELPEWTTGMDFYMWFFTCNAYHMHGVCMQWPIAATEDEDHEL